MKRVVDYALALVTGQSNKGTNSVIDDSALLLFLYPASFILGFFSNYVMIKATGVSNYGGYVYIINSIGLLANFSLFGVDTLLVKNISIYKSASDYNKVKGVLFFSFFVTLIGSIIFSVLSVNTKFLYGKVDEHKVIWLLTVFCFLLLLSVAAISQSTLQGARQVVLSQITDKLIKPAVLITSVTVLFYLKIADLMNLVYSNLFAISVALLVSLIFLNKHLFTKTKKMKPEYKIREWTNSSLIFFLIGTLYMLNSRLDIFLLGLLRGKYEVGVYNIIVKLSEMITFGLLIVNVGLAPVIARVIPSGDLFLLQKIVTRSAQVMLLIGLPIMALIIIFREYLLSFFGVNFKFASPALLILIGGQFMNIFLGSVGLILMMSGLEKFSILSLGIGTILNIVLCLTLIPTYGVMGAAIATAATLIVWNLLMYYFVRKKMSIRTTAIGLI